MVWLAVAANALALLLEVAPAGAAPVCEPGVDHETHIGKGLALREQGRDREALDAFRCAHGLSPTPRTLAQIALAEQALGQWAEAEEHLVEAMKATADPWIAPRLKHLETGLAEIRKRTARLTLRGGPPGATVTVDGRRIGTLPLDRPITLTPGTVSLGVTAPDHLPLTRTLELAAGILTSENVVLVPVKPLPTSPLAGAPSEATLATSAADPQPPPSEGRSWRQPAGWVTLAAGAAFIGAGVTFHVVRAGHLSRFNRKGNGCGEALDDRGRPGCREVYDAIGANGQRAVVGYATGGALAVVGALLLLTAPSSSSEQPSSGLRLSCAPGIGGGSCAVTF